MITRIYKTMRDLFPHSDSVAWSQRLIERLNSGLRKDRNLVLHEAHQLHPRPWHCGQCGLDTYLNEHLRCALCDSDSVEPSDAHRTVPEVEIPKSFVRPILAGISQERR